MFRTFCRTSIIYFFIFLLQVQILFEETFFNQNEESYHVLCIDQLFDGGGMLVILCCFFILLFWFMTFRKLFTFTQQEWHAYMV